LLLWDDRVVQATNIHIGDFSISATILIIGTSVSYKLTTVYGPTRSNLKAAFFQELVDLKPPSGTSWLVSGDFNQIHKARDKNRGNINRRRIIDFRNTLNTCDLKDIHLQNRKFTWSNEQQEPILSNLHGFFCNEDWDVTFSKHLPHALSSSLFDHCPLLLANDGGPKNPSPSALKTFGSRCQTLWSKSIMLGRKLAPTTSLVNASSTN
jgi:hypothetical protein